MDTNITVSDVFSRVSSRYGIEHIFGLLGEGNLNLVLACEKHGQKWIALRHEIAAVVAAETYGQSKGLSVAFVTHGPALLNALNPLVAGLKSKTSLVLVTGEINAKYTSAPQWCDQRTIIESLGINYFRVSDPESALKVIVEAFEFSLREIVPVVLAIPTDMQTLFHEDFTDIANVSFRNNSISEPGATSTSTDILKDAEKNDIDRLVKLIEASQFPVILAGRGAFHAKDELLSLGQEIGALMATTLLAKGLFADSNWGIGFVGGFERKFTHQFLKKADLVIVFGASLNQFTLGYSDVLKQKNMVSINLTKGLAEGRIKNLFEIVGDSAHTALTLIESLVLQQTGFRSDEVQKDIRDFDVESEFTDMSGVNGLDSRRISCFLEKHVPTPRGLTVDLGYFTSEPTRIIGVNNPRHLGWPLSFGSIGVGVGSAIGLSYANPHLPIICAIGDGGLMSCIQELDSVSRYKLPILIAVFNDSSYNVEYQFLAESKDNLAISIFEERSFANIASAFGIRSYEARTISDLSSISEHLREISEPILVDFKVDRSIVTEWWEEILKIVRYKK